MTSSWTRPARPLDGRWALLALVAIMRFVEDGGSLLATLAAVTVTGLLVTCAYLWIEFRYL